MIVELTVTEFTVNAELNSVDLTIKPTLSSGASIKNTSQLLNDGEDGSSPYSTEAYVNDHAGGGGGQAPLYFTTQDSDVEGYRVLSNQPEENLTVVSHSLIAGERILMHQFLYSEPICSDMINAGNWFGSVEARVSNTSGDTRIIAIPIIYHVDPDTLEVTVTELFETQSDEINSTEFVVYGMPYPFGNVALDPSDRVGIRVYASTTTSNKTLYTQIGTGTLSYMTVPISPRHNGLRALNGDERYQHVDERLNILQASAGAASYALPNRRETLIDGTLPNGVDSTFILPDLIENERNESIVHFATNETEAPTLVYSGFTPVWLNDNPISMNVSKNYTIVFERINGIVKTSWGEY